MDGSCAAAKPGSRLAKRPQAIKRQDHLVRIWEDFDRGWQRRSNPTKATWVMWDIALIEAIARPELATAAAVNAPPENLNRPIPVWVEIDATGMRESFWRTFERWHTERR